MKEIESKYSKIKKNVSLYTVNQNFYYWKDSDKDIVISTIKENFENALGIYLSTNEFFDKDTGSLKIVEFVKDRVEGLFW
ncbi:MULTISPECIES: hypothetical protein [unclassified Lebetimonas]|uniref:hypothetical protein n=1 Tax=unclassified Lebetimonas TaxID=2648158 RepID=UPI000465A4E3|nr:MULTISPECIES: hypothetical protein [unclassified Lebetimonas]